jgi:hypothetical protein
MVLWTGQWGHKTWFNRDHFHPGIQHWLELGREQHACIDDLLMDIHFDTIFPDISDRAIELRMAERPC